LKKNVASFLRVVTEMSTRNLLGGGGLRAASASG
jgi:hypothetical protein